MDLTAYQAFLDRLCANVKPDPNVIGLVGLGSTGNPARRDMWSDHDFFLIVQRDPEPYRRRLDWLPDSQAIVMQVRETAHGLKVLYANGHLIEFAVFDHDELSLARVNDYEVLLDKDDIRVRLAELRQISEAPPADPLRELQLTLGILHVGISRWARGESISAHAFLKSHALTHVLTLLAAVSGGSPLLDNLDPYRRFERGFPDAGAELNRLLLLPPLDYTNGLLALIERLVKPRMSDFPQAALDTLRLHIARAQASAYRGL